MKNLLSAERGTDMIVFFESKQPETPDPSDVLPYDDENWILPDHVSTTEEDTSFERDPFSDGRFI